MSRANLILSLFSTDKLVMAEIPPWVAALKIKEEEYLEWISIFPSTEFVLSWAIESKRVDETAYLKWATSFYKLPVLKPNFFQKNPPPVEVWKKYAQGPWSPTVLPLYEYKETLFVGVLEPKNFTVADGVKVQLVLSPSTLQSPWWSLFTHVRKEVLPVRPPAPPAPPAKSSQAPAPVPTPIPPPPEPKVMKVEAVEKKINSPNTLAEDTLATQAGRKTFMIETLDRPATPLGLEDNEIVPEEQSEYQVEINSPNPAVIEPPVPPPVAEPPTETEKNEMQENTGKFARVSAKSLDGAPESVAHALEILKAARQAQASTVERTSVHGPALSPDLGLQISLPPAESPSPDDDPEEEVIPPPLTEVTKTGIPIEAPLKENTLPALELEPPPLETPAPEKLPPPPPVAAPPVMVSPPAVEVVVPPLSEARPPLPAESSISQLAGELLKPEKRIDLSVETPTKVTKIKTSASRKDTSFGFDDLIAPVIYDDISPEGITFDLKSIPPPAPPPDKLDSDILPDGLKEGLELIYKFPRPTTPDGISPIEIPAVDVNALENLVLEEVEVELPSLDLERQQTIVDDLVTAVRRTTLAPTHQGSTPTAIAPSPSGSPQKPSITGPEGKSVEEIVFTGVPEGSIKVVLDKIKQVFQRGMVLLRQEGRLRPYQWDPSWPLDLNERGDVELALQSLFKIVIESKHPFHGVARPCIPNDRFFKKWNKSEYQHVTALPLKAHDEVFGVLLAVASAENAPTIVLPDWEKVAEGLSLDLAKQIGAAA